MKHLRRAVSIASVAVTAGVGLGAAVGQASAAYTCYWATSACGYGTIAPSGGWLAAGSHSPSERPFMNNQTTATSNKRIQRFDLAGAWDGGAWNGGPQIWVVQIFNQQNRRWGCYNNPHESGGTISVNCGYHY